MKIFFITASCCYWMKQEETRRIFERKENSMFYVDYVIHPYIFLSPKIIIT